MIDILLPKLLTQKFYESSRKALVQLPHEMVKLNLMVQYLIIPLAVLNLKGIQLAQLVLGK